MNIYESPLGQTSVPDCTITEWLFAGLETRRDETVFVDGISGRSYSGAELMEMIQRIAGGLVERGMGDGKVTAIMAPNTPEYCAVFHGTAFAGGTVTTLNPTYTAEEVEHQLTDSGAQLLVTVPEFLDTARAGVKGTQVTEIVVIGEAEGATPLSALMGAPLMAQAKVDPADHVVALPYSSGTTGLPKGVMLTHRNLVANFEQCKGVITLQPGESTVAVLPFFHIYAMTVLMNFFPASGGKVITLPRFDMEQFLDLIEQNKCRQVYVVPPIILGLSQHPLVDEHDISSLEMLVSAAAPLGPELTRAAADRLSCIVAQGYGMTEMSPVSHFSTFGYVRDGAVGRAVASTQCRILDPESGQDVPRGEAGELWVRGPQVMKGYLNRPEATEGCMQGEWLQTGDLARIDEDGYLFILDRLKELIKYKGFQVAPAELEEVLLAHPSVADAAVIGLPDVAAGELPVAYLVAAPGQSIQDAAIHAHMDEHLSHYKQLHGVHVVDSIPKSASGKILRRMLRDQAAEAAKETA